MKFNYKILHFLHISILSRNLLPLTAECHPNIFNETSFKLSDHKLLLADHLTKIVSNFNALVVFFYIEIGSSLRLSNKILQKFHQCGIATTVLREKENKNFEINDDGIMMYFIAIVRNSDSLFKIHHIRKHSGDKHRSYFIILVGNSEKLTPIWLKKAFEEFWKIWVLNVIVIYYKFDQIQIYTYSPFTETNFLKKLSYNHIEKNQFFSETLPNMNKSPLRIALHPEINRAIATTNINIYKGVDGRFSDFIIQRLNATKILILPTPSKVGIIFPNGSANGGIGTILRDEADLAMNVRFLVPINFKNKVEFTNVFGREDLCIMVPKGQHALLFFNVIRCFKYHVWLMILLTLLLATTVLKFLSRNDIIDSITSIFSGICTIPILFHRNDGNNYKIFIGFWLGFCFFINSAYKCNLTSSLMLPISLKDYDTLEDLINFPHKILTRDGYYNALSKYIDYSFEMYPEVHQKILNVSTDFMYDKIKTEHLNYAFMEKEHLIDYLVKHKNYTRHGRPLYHKMKVCPIPLLQVYIVQYGSPYLGYINTLLRRVDEYGFLDYWNRIYERYHIAEDDAIAINYEERGPKVLKLKHFQATFSILLAGLGISSIVLMCEIIWKRYN